MIGETLGRYRILAELGRGGMGVVYRATQTTLDRTVAIKMLSPHLAGSGDHLQRFRREAEVLARLQHENIVHIYDVEEVEGSFCIVMEFVAGPSLADVLARSGTLDEARTREIAMALAEGLEAAHRRGVIHRDLKPDNILFTPEGRPKITDFGIARIAGDDAMSRTRTGILLGTPYYMSPEQAGGGEITGASDQYALGVLLYQMLGGSVPFDGNDPISVAIKHMQETPTPLEHRLPGLHPGMAEVVRRTMQKDPAKRYPSAGAMASALKRLRLDELTEGVGWIAGVPHGDPTGPPSELPARGMVVDGSCPACGSAVQADFRSCPRCGHALTWGGAAGAAPAAAHAAPSSAGTVSPLADPSVEPPPAPPEPLDAGPSPGDRLAEVAGGVAGGFAAWMEGTRPRISAGLERWTRPDGRWNLPPILWVGVALVVVGLSLGLARVLSPSAGAGSSAAAPADAGVRAAAPEDQPALPPPGGGGTGAGEAGLGFRSMIGGGSGSSGTTPASRVPGSGSTAPETAPDAGPTQRGEEARPRTDQATPPRTTDTTAPERAPESGADRVAAPDRVTPPARDLVRERADLTALVDRQRRATENGDEALFRRDLSADLARVHAPSLAQLHRSWAGISSEVTNLAIELPPIGAPDPDLARVDFHTRIWATPRSGGMRQLIEDTHVYWVVRRTDRGWIVVEATSAPHQQEQSR